MRYKFAIDKILSKLVNPNEFIPNAIIIFGDWLNWVEAKKAGRMQGHNQITITFLGTGTSQGVPVIACNCDVCQSKDPKDKRLRSSLYIHVNGKNLVIDAGPDFRQQMLAYDFQSLRAILLTHEHVDHIFGLDDIRSFNWKQKQAMDIYAEERVELAIKRVFDYVFATSKYPGIPQMQIHRVENIKFNIDDIEVLPVRGLHHKLPVYGFRIGDMAYLTDVNHIPETEKHKLQGLKVLVVNALRKEKHISHFNLKQALSLSKELNPGKTYLTHISHAMGLHKMVQDELPDNVFLAYDGLQLDIS